MSLNLGVLSSLGALAVTLEHALLVACFALFASSR
jgi:hypothetical protein